MISHLAGEVPKLNSRDGNGMGPDSFHIVIFDSSTPMLEPGSGAAQLGTFIDADARPTITNSAHFSGLGRTQDTESASRCGRERSATWPHLVRGLGEREDHLRQADYARPGMLGATRP